MSRTKRCRGTLHSQEYACKAEEFHQKRKGWFGMPAFTEISLLMGKLDIPNQPHLFTFAESKPC